MGSSVQWLLLFLPLSCIQQLIFGENLSIVVNAKNMMVNAKDFAANNERLLTEIKVVPSENNINIIMADLENQTICETSPDVTYPSAVIDFTSSTDGVHASVATATNLGVPLVACKVRSLCASDTEGTAESSPSNVQVMPLVIANLPR